MSNISRRVSVGLAAMAIIASGAVEAVGQTPPAGYPNGTSVVATKHNLSWAAQADTFGVNALEDYGEVCVYCHTPHGGSLTQKPLWNHGASAASYTMYDNVWSSTIDMTVDAAPSGVSLSCLSCHDGTVGLDVITNVPNSYTGTGAVGTTMPAGRITNLGIDLRDDHPVSVTYSTADDNAFNAVASVESAGLVFYSSKVQCGTCHNPHSNPATNAPFLRIANSASALCTTCHVK